MNLSAQSLRAFVEAEQQFAQREWEEKRSRDLPEQVLSGDLITSLTLLERRGRELVLNAPVNESKFREGDSLLLRDEQDTVRLPVRFMEDHRSARTLTVRIAEDGPSPPQPWFLEASLMDLTSRLLEAIARVEERPQANTVLFGEVVPEVDAYVARDYQQAAPAKLNPSQQRAYAEALSCLNYTTIQGPPGTGKTAVIAAVVQQAVQDGARVLITAQTHKAVNNALAAVQRLQPSFAVLKFGHEDHAMGLSEEIIRVPSLRSGDQPLQEPGVMGAVLVSASGVAEKIGAFDLVLCDEASQVTLPLAACALASGERWVFVGDSQQLPPIIRSMGRGERARSESDSPYTQSIFEFLQRRGGGVLLDVTYRLNGKLATWTSNEFYGGQLRAYPTAALKRLKVQTNFSSLLDPSESLVLGLVNQPGNTDSNEAEALIAARLIHELHTVHGHSLADLGVTAPFRAQNRLIRALIEAQLGQTLECNDQSLLIDTVDRAQGQEREAMIVSLTASEPAYAKSLISFILSPERLNVAITRARTKCIILLSPALLSLRGASTSDVVLLNRVHRMVRTLPTYDVKASAASTFTCIPYTPPPSPLPLFTEHL